MKPVTESVEQYLRALRRPEHESAVHRAELRRRAIEALESTNARQPLGISRTFALAVGLVLCGGAMAAVIGVKVFRFYFAGQEADGTYLYLSPAKTLSAGVVTDADGVSRQRILTTTTAASVMKDVSDNRSPAEMQQDLEEMAQLRELDQRTLIRVTDMQVNGHYWRGCVFEYTLADGRVIQCGEPVPSAAEPEAPEAELAQIEALRAHGLRNIVSAVDTVVQGQRHRVLVCRYTLGEREVTVGEPDAELPTPAVMLTLAQQEELKQLLREKQGRYLGRLEQDVQGHRFAFETYEVTLSDGTVVTAANGEPCAGKTRLSQSDWDELKSQMQSGAGELLGSYEEAIRGRVYRFEQKRYVLADGTEVVRADGDPTAD